MKVGSMFAGIGGFDLGFERAGFDVAWCIEWDKNAQAVLRKRFPNANVYGDIREVDPAQLERVDVVCGGFPCQDLSVAGKRAGLAGERSGLFHDAMRIVRRLRPAVLILENVPGLHSSNRGLDFATVLREVGEGWDCQEVAWRVLDSQYFGVAQRRRRVFIVGSARTGCAEQILALAKGGGGNPPSRDKAREETPADAASGTGGGRRWDGSDCSATLTKQNANGSQRMPDKVNFGAVVIDRAAFNQGTNAAYEPRIEQSESMSSLVARGPHAVSYRKSRRAQHANGMANTLNGFDTGDTRTTHAVAYPINGMCINKELRDKQMTGIGSEHDPMYAIRAFGTQHSVAISFHPTQDPISSAERTHALGCGSKQGCATVAVAHAFYSTDGSHGVNKTSEISPPLKIGSALGIPSPPAVCNSTIVRRLTPVECERLQGFPDGWTQIGTDKPTADTQRYKQLGNAVTVNVAEWIARRTAEALA